MPPPSVHDELQRFLGVVTCPSLFQTCPKNLLHCPSNSRRMLSGSGVPVSLSVDASSKVVGAIILQNNHLIAYASKALNERLRASRIMPK